MANLSTLQDSRSPEISSLGSAVQTSQPISGGLWTPTNFPKLSENDIAHLAGLSYQQIAQKVL